ncbi:short-chain dehydrogenase/reductase SDR [Paenibacillus curdlanolyticus YK9]|uniref:Short-chain dehydrogenase/reductase SDR n=1 Tax=Paenibacillus curdlanolyticus YK9 TaxID=717606 RepID=E0IG16_9BACL|nr:SDR family NAD(P)-dependent oxidoreductase [Paenibacillus curdlanolyticus]EFM08596.1 short-chain dehydrogenase/reductase SDR [Paenibacillus curdlanolyticus YK9]
MKLAGHTILITGGASGIGLALTEAFAQRGNRVIVVGRDERKLNQLTERLPDTAAIVCDLGVEQQVDELVARLAADFPELNVLINNAGIQHIDDWTTDSAACLSPRIAREIAVNLTTPAQLTAKLLPLLSRHEEAAVVNVSSGLGLVPKQSAPIYCATKAAIHSFSIALRYQLEPTSVRVFEIIPPVVDTEMTRGRGRGKITPEALAASFMRSWQRNRYEVPIGKVKLLKALNRLVPALAANILRKG